MSENKLLTDIKDHINSELKKIGKEVKNFEPVRKYTIDASTMPTPKQFSFDDRRNFFFGKMFTELDTIDSPCIYWWSLGTKAEAEKAHKKILAYRKKRPQHGRSVPPDNKNKDSRYLYLGKRNGKITKRKKYSAITSRVYQHLGYYSKGSQGLQICHWSKERLTLNVLVIPKELQPYLETFEKALSMKYKPLLGRH